MAEDAEEVLARILNLCESDPDAGLALIDRAVEMNPESESNPFAKFARAMAYGSKGLFQLWRTSPDIDFTTYNEAEMRDDFGITDTHLDYLEKGLEQIREMEEIYPGALQLFGTEEDRKGESRVDAMALVLERCRPGRVQQLLGKTKLEYFGPERVFKLENCEISDEEFGFFRNVFFTCGPIARSAVLRVDGTDSGGRRYVSVVLYREAKIVDESGEESPVAGFVCLCDDGSCAPGVFRPDEYTSSDEEGL